MKNSAIRRTIGITMVVMLIVMLMGTANTETVRNYTSWEGNFRMVVNENTHVCGYKTGDEFRTIGIQTAYGSFPNFIREKAFAEVKFIEGYSANKIAANGFTVFYGTFVIYDEFYSEVLEVVQNRYSRVFQIPKEEVEYNQETISFATMKFEYNHAKTYCAHKFFTQNDCRVKVGYLRFGDCNNQKTVPIFLGTDVNDTIYERILGFDINEHFDVYGAKANISGIKVYGYANFLISSNFSIEGMISPDEDVKAIGVQEHPNCKAPSNINENGPIRDKAKSEVVRCKNIGFTNLYCEMFIFPEWVDAAIDYASYIIDEYSIPDGPNQLIQAFITGASHFEVVCHEKHVGGTVSYYEGEYGSHIFFTEKNLRNHIGNIWFANGQTVEFYMGDFYETGKLVFGFAPGFRIPEPTATPEPTRVPHRPSVTSRPECQPTCPPCQPTCPPYQPTCVPCQPTCQPQNQACKTNIHIKFGVGVCFEIDIRRNCK